MTRPERLRHVAALPEPAPGWFNVRQMVDVEGDLICLTASQDVVARWSKRCDDEPQRVAARLTLFDGADVKQCTEFVLDYRHPVFDRLPDGCWVVSTSRCEVGQTRSSLLSPTGVVVQQFCLGDGIAHLQCDAVGNVWVAYFDEGIFGNLGWGFRDGSEPIGSAGLVKFDRTGRALWRYSDPPPYDFTIDDCYSHNAARETWACFYSDFPALLVGEHGETRCWVAAIHGITSRSPYSS